MKLFNQLLLTSAFALPSFLSAGTTGQVLQVHVPFSFMVGAQQFSAGDYRVQESDNGVLYVQGEGKAAAAITIPADLKTGSSTSSLRFSSAEQHYLKGVQVQGVSARSLVTPEEQRKLTLTSSR